MKLHLMKPGFEFIFALSVMAIIGLPPLVFAQNTRDVEIKITNGDTLVNGKNIKDLSDADRRDALKDIDKLGKMGDHPLLKRQSFNDHILIRKDGMGDTIRQRVIIQDSDPYASGKIRSFTFKTDTSEHRMRVRFRRPNGKDSTMAFNFRMNPDKEFRFDSRDFKMPNRDFEMSLHGRGFEMHRRNSQNFSYTNTGSDGIRTSVTFSVSDASPEKTKKITSSDKAELELTDLTLVPEFTSGKTLLMFSLPAHSPAEVKFMDNEGKVIWSEKSMNGSFSKSFALGLNGMYLLEVKQGGKVALKRVIKEE
jgi:hypothetical protein